MSAAILAGIQGPGPGGGNMDGLDWDSSLFDELSDLVGGDDDLLQDDKSDPYETNFDNLDFNIDLMSWNYYPWSSSDQYCTVDSIKPEPLSPASSSYSVASPQSVDSSSSSQNVPEELDVSSAQMSPVSLYSESSKSPKSPEIPEEKPVITTRPTSGQAPFTQRKLAPVVPKPSIQPKTILIPATADIQAPAGIAQNTFIIQPFTPLLPKQQPLITLQPAPSTGQQVLLTSSSVVQIPASGIVTAQPVLTVSGGTTTVQTPSLNLLSPGGQQSVKTSPVKPLIPSSLRAMDTGADLNVMRRQQRMIKNRESAFQSRRKKKEYMQTLELRLRAALSENEKLKKENGSLQKLLEEVVFENQKLKVTAPKRRAVCLMMVAAFLLLNFNPLSVLVSSPGPYDVEVGQVRSNRHLLGFSEVDENEGAKQLPENTRSDRYISNEKALMVVKEEQILYIPPVHPCRPIVNKTESLRLNHELRGWVHRHEVERTKSRRMTNTHRTVQKPEEKMDSSLVTVQYTDTSVKNSANELQIYYSSPRSYQDFLDAIRRRGDTFYVVSFRRDHLLLPATNRNKTSRPKMSIILPSPNVHENIINGQDVEVMMQIDCEVMDTRILHVKSSTIPPFLREHRENQTNSFYNSATTGPEAAQVVSAIQESPL
ncbi:cyclic AMP-dependent transcription factor ATF-6 alpha [Discoglossus pictus]